MVCPLTLLDGKIAFKFLYKTIIHKKGVYIVTAVLHYCYMFRVLDLKYYGRKTKITIENAKPIMYNIKVTLEKSGRSAVW